MAREKGVQITCDRCGASVFLKFLRMEPREYQDPIEAYETMPPGWAAATSLGKNIHLCPACAVQWADIQTAFMKVSENSAEG